jgi:hypothetical protein
MQAMPLAEQIIQIHQWGRFPALTNHTPMVPVTPQIILGYGQPEKTSGFVLGMNLTPTNFKLSATHL